MVAAIGVIAVGNHPSQGFIRRNRPVIYWPVWWSPHRVIDVVVNDLQLCKHPYISPDTRGFSSIVCFPVSVFLGYIVTVINSIVL